MPGPWTQGLGPLFVTLVLFAISIAGRNVDIRDSTDSLSSTALPPSIQLQPKVKLSNDEDILQMIDAISRDQYCIRFPFSKSTTTEERPSHRAAKKTSKTTLVAHFKREFQSSQMSRFNHRQVNIPLSPGKQSALRSAFTENERCRRSEKVIDLLASVLRAYDPDADGSRLLNDSIRNTPLVDGNIFRYSLTCFGGLTVFLLLRVSVALIRAEAHPPRSAWFRIHHCIQVKDPLEPDCVVNATELEVQLINGWFPDSLMKLLLEGRYLGPVSLAQVTEWSDLFFDCHDKRWFITYHALILEPDMAAIPGNATTAAEDEEEKWYVIKGVISADVDVTDSDINQCDSTSSGTFQAEPNNNTSNNTIIADPIVLNLPGTHKCHPENSNCKFQPGHGMFRGGYQCQCKNGFHSAVTNLGPTFNGSLMEQSYQDKHDGKNPSYDYMFYCKRCAPGCEICRDESPCLSSYNWAFRISLLTITILCILFVFVLAFNIYRYRKLKVIKMASPIFLCITLLGCVIMYCETVVIFPALDVTTCVLTKWTRNFGFCITYSALLLKTWRVSLTYRVKSAHKIKLTDKQLLQWLFPILLVMAIYLAAWTISDTPRPKYIVDWNELKFKQCDYNWWDHSLTIGEFLFLLWGIKVCYNVRNAESLFNEAKYITWAIYNITLVNSIMILTHVFILPNSGPDLKYFFGFVRTQLSTTTTVILIFGPKFYRVVKGEGDLWEKQLRARGMAAASFSFNGVGLAHEETTDLYQENEELKEEIQKLATQLEIMKLCQMEFRNRHLSTAKFSKMQQQMQNE